MRPWVRCGVSKIRSLKDATRRTDSSSPDEESVKQDVSLPPPLMIAVVQRRGPARFDPIHRIQPLKPCEGVSSAPRTIAVPVLHLTLHVLLNGKQGTAVGGSAFGVISRFVPRCLQHRVRAH